MHKMTLVATSEHGTVEKWVCPICQQTLLITWDPFKVITIVDGDLTVSHVGSKGGLVIGDVEVKTGA